MPTYAAQRELLSSREEVWRFLAEPHHLPDWWPGLAAVDPDRRGLAPGARWHIRAASRPGLVRRPDLDGLLVVLRVREPDLVAWQLRRDRVEVELQLADAAPERTLATLSVDGPWLIGLRRSLPRTALARLHALCQTASDL